MNFTKSKKPHELIDLIIKLIYFIEKDVEHLKAVVHGVIMDMPVPFDLPNDNACENCNITCPLKSGETYTYSTSLPVLKSYPRVSFY